MADNILFKTAPLGELKDYDDQKMIIQGYGSYFDNKDADGDVIKKGAYKKTIEENGSRVKYLYQHKMDKPIGKMQELYEDDKGLVFQAKIADTQLGRDVYTLMKSRTIYFQEESFNRSFTIDLRVESLPLCKKSPCIAFALSWLSLCCAGWAAAAACWRLPLKVQYGYIASYRLRCCYMVVVLCLF